MAMWFVVETLMSTVGAYNISKGIYNIYRDARVVKKQYRQYQKTAEQYLNTDPLTESQFHRLEDDFVVLGDKTPFKAPPIKGFK